MASEYVLFVWQCDVVIVLDCHGECMSETTKSEVADLLAANIRWDDAPGVYLAEVHPYTIHYHAGDYDLGLSGSARLATAEELRAFVGDEYWHDLPKPETGVEPRPFLEVMDLIRVGMQSGESFDPNGENGK